MARRTVSLDELDHFEVDESDQLYWKGRQVRLEQRIRLEALERTAAVFASASVVVIATIEVLRAVGIAY